MWNRNSYDTHIRSLGSKSLDKTDIYHSFIRKYTFHLFAKINVWPTFLFRFRPPQCPAQSLPKYFLILYSVSFNYFRHIIWSYQEYLHWVLPKDGPPPAPNMAGCFAKQQRTILWISFLLFIIIETSQYPHLPIHRPISYSHPSLLRSLIFGCSVANYNLRHPSPLFCSRRSFDLHEGVWPSPKCPYTTSLYAL